MELIKRIRIQRFRSIEDMTIDDVSSLNTFVGKNSSGKSNILRALNLFFNDEVEYGKRVDFSRDYFLTAVPTKKKKQITITVGFVLPKVIHFRKGLEGLAELGERFAITRKWELDQRRNPISFVEAFKTDGKPIPNSRDLARQFLTLISYRYIPNRTIPADLLRDESRAVADAIFMRMKGDQHAATLLESLGAAATRMFGRAEAEMKSAGSPLEAPRLSLGKSMAEMLTMSGFQATAPSGGDVQDEDWGSGHQAFFLLYCTLLIRTTVVFLVGDRQRFGVSKSRNLRYIGTSRRVSQTVCGGGPMILQAVCRSLRQHIRPW